MRGEKFCSCGCSNGVRSFQCKSCGKGFTIQGVKQPDIQSKTINKLKEVIPKPIELPNIITKPKNIKKNIKKRDKPSQYIKKCSDENELSKYSRVWDSINGRYRIRLNPKVFGVNMTSYGKYQLLEFCLDYWKPIDRFTTLKSAVDYFIKKDKKYVK